LRTELEQAQTGTAGATQSTGANQSTQARIKELQAAKGALTEVQRLTETSAESSAENWLTAGRRNWQTPAPNWKLASVNCAELEASQKQLQAHQQSSGTDKAN